MNTGHLVTMANEIAAFFAAEPDRNVAAEQVANHLRRFWAPQMRDEIRRHAQSGGAGLSDLAKQGVARL
jgi:formate dehydrogenase subunit delta